MKNSEKWTSLDEAMLTYSRTLEQELRKTHSTLFVADFLDEFEQEIRGAAINAVYRNVLGPRNRPK